MPHDRRAMVEGPSKSALISPCETYRYRLGREWDRGRTVMFLMLNPSTADASVDDPTIRRCIGFAKTWGYARLLVGNLFALRSPDPKALREARDPVGPDNDTELRRMADESDLVVAAWGAHKLATDRAVKVRRLLDREFGCLGTTKQAHPRHPLYVKSDARLWVWMATCPQCRSALGLEFGGVGKCGTCGAMCWHDPKGRAA